MQWKSYGALLVVSVAAVVGAAQSAASAAPRVASVGGAVRGRAYLDARDPAGVLDPRRGPFLGLRVQSLDVAGDAKNLACWEYACDGLAPGEPPSKYELVRTAYDVKVAPGDCDEVTKLPLPAGTDLRGFRGRLEQKRWMRRSGPSGTPIGGFVGRLRFAAVVGADDRAIPLFDFALAGTTGLRPMRGDPDDATSLDEGRCRAPRRDEGWYLGRVEHRALLAYAKESGGDARVIGMLRRLHRALLGGTFEGRLGLPTDDDRTIDYCRIERGAWWFDGLLAWDCRPHRLHVDAGAGADADAEIGVDAEADAGAGGGITVGRR